MEIVEVIEIDGTAYSAEKLSDVLRSTYGNVMRARTYCHELASAYGRMFDKYEFCPVVTHQEQELRYEYKKYRRWWALLNHLFNNHNVLEVQ